VASKSTGDGVLSPEQKFAVSVGTFFPWLRRVCVGDTLQGSVRFTGISVRLEGGTVLVVVRGLNVTSMKNVVAFGAGDRLYAALRNVTLALGKGQWHDDKFRKFVP
jgi:hypothetical protein